MTRFWRGVAAGRRAGGAPAAAEAARDALRLKYLDGGHGEGCNNADDAWTPCAPPLPPPHVLRLPAVLRVDLRGHALPLRARLAGAVRRWTSLPVLLGTLGGIGLLVGPAGLLWLNLRRHPLHGDAAQQPMDRGFIALLFGDERSRGLALLAWRDTPAHGAAAGGCTWAR